MNNFKDGRLQVTEEEAIILRTHPRCKNGPTKEEIYLKALNDIKELMPEKPKLPLTFQIQIIIDKAFYDVAIIS